jgi:hypothetical protein
MLLRGEHWLQENRQRVDGTNFDLGTVELLRGIDGLVSNRQLGGEQSLIRFQIHPNIRDQVDDTPRPKGIVCCGVVANDQRGMIESPGGYGELVIRGKLSSYSGSRLAAGRRPAFEIALTHICAVPDRRGSAESGS